MNYEIKNVHISTIKAGDTIDSMGHFKTVTNSNIGRDELLGITLFGDSYASGRRPVKKVIINRAMPVAS